MAVIIQDTEVQINPHIQTQNINIVIVILNHRVETVHHNHELSIIRINLIIILKIHTQITLDRPQSPYHNRDGNRSRRPFSRTRLGNVRNYINILLVQEQIDDTMSNAKNTETQNVSEEKLLEQQFNDLLLELNQDAQDKYFNCREECNTLTK